MKTWKRADGASVTLAEYADLHGPRIVRVYKADGEQVIQKLFEYWQVREANETAEELADLIGAEPHAEVNQTAA